jgi:hypothetical protein
MTKEDVKSFTAQIEIIGINPFVFLPESVLNKLFKQAGKDKGKIPVKMKIDGHPFIQTLVRYSGHWRLYLNTPMRNAAGKQVGDAAEFEISYDPDERVVQMHPRFKEALNENKKAKAVFDKLPASRKHEIIRYISNLKTEASVERNIIRAINFLQGKERFVGRESK